MKANGCGGWSWVRQGSLSSASKISVWLFWAHSKALFHPTWSQEDSLAFCACLQLYRLINPASLPAVQRVCSVPLCSQHARTKTFLMSPLLQKETPSPISQYRHQDVCRTLTENEPIFVVLKLQKQLKNQKFLFRGLFREFQISIKNTFLSFSFELFTSNSAPILIMSWNVSVWSIYCSCVWEVTYRQGRAGICQIPRKPLWTGQKVEGFTEVTRFNTWSRVCDPTAWLSNIWWKTMESVKVKNVQS